MPFLSPAAPALQANEHGSEIKTGPALLARRDHRAAVFFADFVDGADVRVIQCRGGPRFSPEAFQRLRVVRHLFGQEFQRHEPPERRVPRLIHHAHPASAELFHDSVVRNGLPEK